METYHLEEQYTEDEIDLRELILVLWNKKLMIISFTLIVAILTGLFSIFVLTPVYKANLNIVINMPDAYHTKYGDYTLPIRQDQEYINLIKSNDVLSNTIEDMDFDKEVTIENLQKRIEITVDSKNDNQNIYNIKVSADNPEEARLLAQTLYDNYTEFLNVTTLEAALDYYENSFSTSLKSLEVSLETNKTILEKNEELLAQTPPTINQKAALDEVQDQLASNDFIILEKVINPNYTKLETDIINNKQSINSIENSMNVYTTYLEELAELRDLVKQYYQTGDYAVIGSEIVSVTDISLYLPSQPMAPSQKTSPSNFMNVCIGTVLGGMVAVGMVLFRWWWQAGSEVSQDKKKKAA